MVTLPQTAIQKMLGCRYPIIQTAMGWVATPELVAGTSNAGGFGFLAAGVMRADEVGPAIDKVQAARRAKVPESGLAERQTWRDRYPGSPSSDKVRSSN